MVIIVQNMDASTPVVTRAMDINIDPKCSRTMDPDTTISSSLGPDVTIPTPLSSMDLGGSPDSEQLQGLQ